MTTLPAAAFMNNNARTQGEMKQAFEDQRQFIEDMFGVNSAKPPVFNNALINGDFRIDQRRGDGTAYTSATVPLNSDDTVLLDRWILLSDGNNIVDVKQETTVVPSGAYASIALDVETGNKKFGIVQILEAKDTKALAGQTVSLSFKARTTGAISIDHLRAGIVSWTSTADSPTTDLVSAWNAAGSDPTLVANWAFDNTPASLAALTTAFQTFVIENISIASGANNLAIFIWSDDVTTTVTEILYIGDVQLTLGSVAHDFFERRPLTQELTFCQRYYIKTFNQGTIPAQNAGTGGAALYSIRVGGVHFDGEAWLFPVVMRAAPTLIFYNPSASNTKWRNTSLVADSGAAAASETSDRAMSIRNPQVGGDNVGNGVIIHATAEAEF